MALPRAARRAAIPYLILFVGLAVTVLAAVYAHAVEASERRMGFAAAADRVRYAIDNRLDAYIAMLGGAAGLFAASDEVRLPEFRAYVARLELPTRYPGIQGIGFSRLIREQDREEILGRMRADGQPVTLWPAQRGDVHAILFLEPLDRRNRRALGFDMFSEPWRREAMTRAGETGLPAATAPVRLVQEDPDGDVQAGFLIYTAVYRGGSVPQSVESRRERLFGFVYSPFRADDLLTGILGSDPDGVAGIEVYDGDPAGGLLLHRSVRGVLGMEQRRTTLVAGRPWTLVVRADASAGPTRPSAVVLLVALGGTMFSALLFTIMQSEIRARDAAERTTADLRRSEHALLDALRAKDEFLAMVSHELRTPLNAIVGWAAMLQRGHVPPEQQAHALRVISRNAAAQTSLIEDLLDMSLAVAGGLRLKLVDTDLAAVLSSAIDAVRPTAQARGVRLECEVQPDLGLLRADPARLQQVIWNLLTNGIKFTPPGGVVRLHAAREAGAITVTVSDTGIGIPPGFLPHVFDRFRQADTSTTRAHGGIGLGLAIARHLVEAHGGSISAESHGEGRGSTFRMVFPPAGGS